MVLSCNFYLFVYLLVCLFVCLENNLFRDITKVNGKISIFQKTEAKFC